MKVECGVYMVERRTLDDVLADLKEAEKEYKEKCLKYGITEKHKRKKDDESQDLQENDNLEAEEETSEENTSIENNEEVSEN